MHFPPEGAITKNQAKINTSACVLKLIKKLLYMLTERMKILHIEIAVHKPNSYGNLGT